MNSLITKGKGFDLEPDFSLSLGKDPYDFFKLEFDDMVNCFFSFSIHDKIRTKFVTVQEKDVFIVRFWIKIKLKSFKIWKMKSKKF